MATAFNQQRGSVCLLPMLKGIGGPTSFHNKFSGALAQRGIHAHHDPQEPDCKTILVIGGTRHLNLLWSARRRGIRVIQRLDGMNWIHRLRKTGIRHYLRSEVNNLILAVIRRYLSDAIIYQSRFVENHWNNQHSSITIPTTCIYNGVDLDTYTSIGEHHRPKDHIRLLVVEGRLKGGHEVGLQNAVLLAQSLQEKAGKKVELMVAADVDSVLQAQYDQQKPAWITWKNVIPRNEIPLLDRSAHLLFSAEVNAPCPNSVIEALACSLPVVSYATGSLPELVTKDAGALVPYGNQYDKLGPPDTLALASAAQKVLANLTHFRLGARQRAEAAFDLETMTDSYLQFMLN
jgi:glycosyltransferase involved in cell wall biosynthesis